MKGLRELVKDHILVLDGATGTMIQRYNLQEDDFRGERFAALPGIMKGNNDMLNITRPDVVKEIHRLYLEAGADIITTNTFSSQRISMQDYGMEEYCVEMNVQGAQLARAMADEYTAKNPEKPRFVAGSVGPTNKTCSMSPDVENPAFRALTFDTLVEAYTEQMTALIQGGVDVLLLETVFDTLNAKAGLFAADEAMKKAGREVPVMLSVTVSDIAGRTLSGQTMEAFIASVSHYNLFSIGLNCSFGPALLRPHLEVLASKAPFFISCHPNAGLPNSLGQYELTPEMMVHEMGIFVDEGLVNIIGGCCGTTDKHIAAYQPLVERGKPHIPAQKAETLQLSGLEAFEQTPDIRFINVGERCNVAGSRKFLRLISEKKYEEALSIARKQVEDGALILDINMDDALLDAKEEMVTFLNLLSSEPEIARVPVMIDSSKWEVIEAGLKCLQGKSVVNSISLKEGEEKFIERATFIKRMGAATIVMAFDEEGQATTYERRIEVCSRAYKILVEKVGFHPNDIIFDPNILAVATGVEDHNQYALDFIRASAWIRKNLPGAHVSGGVSNLSFSFRGNNYIREAMHAVFLYHAIEKGMDMGIVNPSSSVLYTDIPKEILEQIEAVLFQCTATATDRLIETAQKIREEQEAAKAQGLKGVTDSAVLGKKDSWREGTVEERLEHALVKGVSDYLEPDLMEGLEKYQTPVAVIEGPLMHAMNRVGELFGEGKMFLPQVVKSARTMKKAVEILQPYIQKEGDNVSGHKGRVLLATVKGDVHDIGKNIAGLVMACNGFEIIDLGVMVPAEQIVETALKEEVDAVILSGLITPSLEEMVHVAAELEKAGFKNPLMVSGATTSNLHTALKIAPVYGGPVVHLKDASQNSLALSKLMNPSLHDAYTKELNELYQKLREKHEGESKELVSLEEANKQKLNLF